MSHTKSIVIKTLLIFTLIFSGLLNANPVQSKTVVLTDVHGDYVSLISLLKATNVINDELEWSGNTATLISLGDNLDRGAESRKVIDLFMRLEDEAANSGGNVIVLLGNHEIMNIIADLRYVSDQEFLAFKPEESASYRESVYQDYLNYSNLEHSSESLKSFNRLYPPGYFGLVEAYSHSGKYGKWLLEKDTVKVFQDRLYLHAGISEELLDLGFSEQQINRQIRQTVKSYSELYHEFIELGLFKHYFNKRERIEVLEALLAGQIKQDRFTKRSILKKAEEFIELSQSLLITTKGPVWYRGNIYCHEYMESHTIEKALKHFGVKQVLVGHTPDDSRVARSRFDGKLILLDTGMLQAYYKGQPTAAVIENNQLRLVNLKDPSNTEPQPDPVRKPLYPNQLSDEYLSEYFANAEVISEKPLSDFYSKPLKLTFDFQGKQHNAIFKYMDSDPKLENKRKHSRQDNFADRFLYDLAAFKLDRLLNLYMVPYTAAFTYKDQEGIIQYWIEDSISKTELIQSKQQLEGYCSADDEEELMQIFDLLIHNDDRNTGNKLYSLDTGYLWLIDHTRSFRNLYTLPEYDLPPVAKLSVQLEQQLKSLSKDNLKAELGFLLNDKQIVALLKRRDKLLQLYGQNH
ncbi:metallophosphoesterase [Kangiella aquimarina]|uniref:Metallophosphoesterase n=1 Tax=Kangiella aquimarina TaxID=261965 RepID=A0ABZ0X6N2_9GAMM|nr:metallophosphoesterase [Kangiella aquimarina]WQG86267.1 metallophosphoesterase [Kangiella aquimarina]